jgi:hypothetical protein
MTSMINSFNAPKLLTIVVWFCSVSVAWSQLTFTGSEFQVNSTSGGNTDRSVSVGVSNNGDFAITWASIGHDAIFARRFNTDGIAQGTQFAVNNVSAMMQYFPAMAMNGNGDFVVVWNRLTNGLAVMGRRYNSSGIAQGVEFLVNTTLTGNQSLPVVAMNEVGNFVVAWQQETGMNAIDIYAQRFNSDGIAQGSEFLVNTFTTGSQSQPSIAMDSNGRFIIVWQSYNQDAALSDGIYAQRYNAIGVPQGSEFLVNSTTIQNQQNPSIAIDNNGNFAIAWQSIGHADGNRVYAKLYNNSGVIRVDEFQVGDQALRPTISMAGTGHFMIGYESSQNGPGTDIHARSYDQNAIAQGAAFCINTSLSGSQLYAGSATNKNGKSVVAWESAGQSATGYIYAQRLNLVISPVEWIRAPLVNVFPTVTTGNLTIEGVSEVEISDVLGTIYLPAKKVQQNDFQIDHFPSGIYVLKGVDIYGRPFVKKIFKI